MAKYDGFHGTFALIGELLVYGPVIFLVWCLIATCSDGADYPNTINEPTEIVSVITEENLETDN